ncbi:class I adenylate-forming enzyme family protein [Streptomyces silvisoli]|uniref:Class I adenylate-forming enzyme family protein n=1 Tax=Streptomyces silvisoli TaxID=3034235 RepID=A0ABT5ZKF9_9ACTN|nr:class I adenylate-forming enzyme family protein [Streptomyces silvisoli]MDF3290287.1 class I adenylate-forming enzyme family protein [Streptomyces silvisoli]
MTVVPNRATTAWRLHTILDEAADRHPSAVAVTEGGRSSTYSQLRAWSLALAAWLSVAGVQEGDRVVMRLPNSRLSVALFFGALRAGAIVVPISPDLRLFQLTAVLRDCAPRLVIVEDRETAALRAVCRVDIRGLCELPGDAPVRAVDGEGLGARMLAHAPWSGAPALLMYTSGSTGVPKAVVCPHAQVAFAASAIAAALGYRADDTVFCCIPFSFDYGLYQVLLCALTGAELVLAGGGGLGLRLLSELRACRATVVPLVPSLATLLTRLAEREPGAHRVRLFTNTGETLPDDRLRELRRRFPGAAIVLMYGLTECKRVTIAGPDGDLTLPGTVGRPLPGTIVQVVDDRGRPLPPGHPGEITVRGPHVMAGYWNDGQLTASRFRTSAPGAEVVLYTGDHGHVDPVGNVYLLGRNDGIFKQQGMRTSTCEIETAALDVPGVTAAAAVPPSPGHGSVLWVTGSASSQRVLEGLVRRIGPGKVPDTCFVRDELPLNPHGKTDRACLLAELRRSPIGSGPPTAPNEVVPRYQETDEHC